MEARTQTSPSIREVLELPPFVRGVPEVVAGGTALDRRVRWVHPAEVANIADLVRGGELVLTTGVGIGGHAVDQVRFIAGLADKRVAGLVLELGQRFAEAPSAMVREARHRELPLVVLHREIRFAEASEVANRAILDRQSDLRERTDELHRRLVALMIEGATAADLVEFLADDLSNPILLERGGRGVIYHAVGNADPMTVSSAWDSVTRGLDDAPPRSQHPIPAGGDAPWGRLVVLGLVSPIGDYTRLAAERAAGVLGLALMREMEDEFAEGRHRGRFLSGLIAGEFDEAEAQARARQLGFGSRLPYLLPVAVSQSSVARLDGSRAREWRLLWRSIHGELSARRIDALIGSQDHDRCLLMVMAIRAPSERTRLADTVADIVRLSSDRAFGHKEMCTVSVGSIGNSWVVVGAALAESVESLVLAARGTGSWYDAALPDVDNLLWSLRNRPELHRFASTRLAALVEHDRARRNTLLPTLAAFCQHGGRKAEAARALHIERQSLYHRLGRIEELLGVDLSDSDTMFALHLAVRALPLVDGLQPPASSA